METDKGELHMHFSYDSETGTLSTVIEPIEPELVTEAVYEIMHWRATFLHKQPRLVEEDDDRD